MNKVRPKSATIKRLHDDDRDPDGAIDLTVGEDLADRAGVNDSRTQAQVEDLERLIYVWRTAAEVGETELQIEAARRIDHLHDALRKVRGGANVPGATTVDAIALKKAGDELADLGEEEFATRLPGVLWRLATVLGRPEFRRVAEASIPTTLADTWRLSRDHIAATLAAHADLVDAPESGHHGAQLIGATARWLGIIRAARRK